ncbi:hypothetical protein GF386_06700 [Candidatus Pacearchaeota archaeon]|nr:hypothetical protein [Candidatus Pacearchaeota archaeon]MBD3283781.1 hypothetical protein [Candidatus Pacearchaeota archaeon]
MDIQEFYEKNCLYDVRDFIQGWNPEVNLGTPEVFSDRLVGNWLAFHYIHGLAFSSEGYPVLCSFNGVALQHGGNGHGNRILAIYGQENFYPMANLMQEIHGKSESEIESILREYNDLLFIPSNSRDPWKLDGGLMTPYSDFIGLVDVPTQELAANINMAVLGSGIRGESIQGKHLQFQQYVLNIPYNSELFRRVRGAPSSRERADSIRDARDIVVPSKKVAGARVFVSRERLDVNPVIRESDLKLWEGYLSSRGYTPCKSDITHIGYIEESGKIIAVDGDFLA